MHNRVFCHPSRGCSHAACSCSAPPKKQNSTYVQSVFCGLCFFVFWCSSQRSKYVKRQRSSLDRQQLPLTEAKILDFSGEQSSLHSWWHARFSLMNRSPINSVIARKHCLRVSTDSQRLFGGRPMPHLVDGAVSVAD